MWSSSGRGLLMFIISSLKILSRLSFLLSCITRNSNVVGSPPAISFLLYPNFTNLFSLVVKWALISPLLYYQESHIRLNWLGCLRKMRWTLQLSFPLVFPCFWRNWALNYYFQSYSASDLIDSCASAFDFTHMYYLFAAKALLLIGGSMLASIACSCWLSLCRFHPGSRSLDALSCHLVLQVGHSRLKSCSTARSLVLLSFWALSFFVSLTSSCLLTSTSSVIYAWTQICDYWKVSLAGGHRYHPRERLAHFLHQIQALKNCDLAAFVLIGFSNSHSAWTVEISYFII